MVLRVEDAYTEIARQLLRPTPEQVWQKAFMISPYDEAAGYRRDSLGNIIHRDHYGRRDSCFGWEIDHIVPLSKGGADFITNVRPLYWRANLSKSDQNPFVSQTQAIKMKGLLA